MFATREPPPIRLSLVLAVLKIAFMFTVTCRRLTVCASGRA